MTKKIFIIATAVFVLTLLAFITRRVFFSSSTETIFPEETIQEDQPSGETSSGKLVKIIDGPVQGLTLNPSTRQLLYFQNDKFLLSDFEGKTKNSVGAYPFGGASQIHWSSDGKKAIIKSKEKLFIYDLDRDEANPLPDKVDVAIWGQKGEKILWKEYAEGKRRIIEADNRGNAERVVTEEGLPQRVELISQSIVGKACYYPSPSGTKMADLHCINSQKENKVIDNKGYGVDYLWSPNDQQILISGSSERSSEKISLGLIDSQGGNFQPLNFPTTIKKCVWSNDNTTVYCAMIIGINQGIVMPNAWQNKTAEFNDAFWKIDTTTGKKERMLKSEEITTATDGESFIIDEDEKYLFFIDRKKEDVYRLEI